MRRRKDGRNIVAEPSRGDNNPISLQQKGAWSTSSFRISIRSYTPHRISCVCSAYSNSAVQE